MNSDLSSLIKNEAYRIGFSDCGFAKADFLDNQKSYLAEWLKNKHHADMQYMENHFDKRLDPRVLFEGAKSIIVVSLNYYSEVDLCEKNNFKISKYAYGKDYHTVLKEKLFLLLGFIENNNAACKGKICVDTAPIMEKVWAEKAGIGWIGKNTCLINKKKGSFHFLGEIIVNIELEYDKSVNNYCGSCHKCIDACPTNALNEPYVLNAGHCLSFLTVESKKQMPDNILKKANGWIFGCDICQNICPWNKFATHHQVPEFEPLEATVKLVKKGCDAFLPEDFSSEFKNSAISRADYNIIRLNEEQINKDN